MTYYEYSSSLYYVKCFSYEISAEMFGFMTRQLLNFANGRVVLALEGGYDLASISDAAEQCVKVRENLFFVMRRFYPLIILK